MHAWPQPQIQKLPGEGRLPSLFDASSGRLVTPHVAERKAGLYVCGITPYDATHLGHAFTYLAFDTLLRAWKDAGVTTHYVQNVTDIDDPLLERAKQTQTDWRLLADSQIALFKCDMDALSMVPPDDYVAVTESIELIASSVSELLQRGYAYHVPSPAGSADDIYFDVAAAERDTSWRLGLVSGFEYDDMLRLSAERGGDPYRAGKRNPLDPCLWRAPRHDEPSWSSSLGQGRPGWHIECSAIAVDILGENFTVQGGGLDLVFPHHEFSAAHATALTFEPLAQVYAHAGLVGYQGEKMSKSRGNLVFVSRLLAEGLDPSALRLALLTHHYRSSWEWFDEMALDASRLLERWRASSTKQNDVVHSAEIIEELRRYLADDLDTPGMIRRLTVAFETGSSHPELVRTATQSLLGIVL